MAQVHTASRGDLGLAGRLDARHRDRIELRVDCDQPADVVEGERQTDVGRERLAGAAQRAPELTAAREAAAGVEAGALERADRQLRVPQREAQRLQQEAIAAGAAPDEPRQWIVDRAAERGVVGDPVQAERRVVRQDAVGQIEAAAIEQLDERRQAIEQDGGRDAHAPPPTADTPAGHDTPVPPVPQ